jgi:hypothetical protein
MQCYRLRRLAFISGKTRSDGSIFALKKLTPAARRGAKRLQIYPDPKHRIGYDGSTV